MGERGMTIHQKILSILPPVLLNILLPIFDTGSDARLIVLLFLGGYRCKDDDRHCIDDPISYCTSSSSNCERVNHPWYGILLLVPFLLNYIVSFFTWMRLDNNKKYSFIFVLLNIYAPYGKVYYL